MLECFTAMAGTTTGRGQQEEDIPLTAFPGTRRSTGRDTGSVDGGPVGSALEFLFHPRSIAIVGAPSDPAMNQGAGVFLDSLIAFDYQGHIWPVNPKLSEIRGLPSYPSVLSLPNDPDYVICCIPAALTPQLVKDCAHRGVKAISIYTAGFSEASERSADLEQELVMVENARTSSSGSMLKEAGSGISCLPWALWIRRMCPWLWQPAGPRSPPGIPEPPAACFCGRALPWQQGRLMKPQSGS